jgi:hypothetical protein
MNVRHAFKFFLRTLPDQRGAAIVELTLSLPILLILVIIATDFCLEQLAIAQVETATIAAIEYATNKDCNIDGMNSAASKAISQGYTKWLISNLSVSASAYCACGVDTGGLVTKGTDAPKCQGYFCGSNVAAAAYVNIGVSGVYHPLAPKLWWQSNQIPLSRGAVVRTFGSSTTCSG